MQLFFNIDNNQKCFLNMITSNHHIRVISEGSCDSEDWSDDAENTALITGINYILKFYCIYLFFSNKIKAPLVRKRDFFQKT